MQGSSPTCRVVCCGGLAAGLSGVSSRYSISPAEKIRSSPSVASQDLQLLKCKQHLELQIKQPCISLTADQLHKTDSKKASSALQQPFRFAYQVPLMTGRNSGAGALCGGWYCADINLSAHPGNPPSWQPTSRTLIAKQTPVWLATEQARSVL